MTETRRLKKSETLEVRLSHEAKQAFMARCQADGLTASEAVRTFIDARLTPPPGPQPQRRVRYLALGAAVAAALGAVAAPSLAKPAASAQFTALDVDGDARVSVQEFARLDADSDGLVSYAEFRAAPSGTVRPGR